MHLFERSGKNSLQDFSGDHQTHGQDSTFRTYSKTDRTSYYSQRYYHPDSAPAPEVRVIVELKGDPLAKIFQRERSTEANKSAIATKQLEYEALFASLKRDVKQINKTTKSSGESIKPVFEQKYTKLILGQRLIIDRSQIEHIKALPYVKNVHIDQVVKTNLDESIPQINADSVWHEFDNEGDSVRVGIIDTGIDYMHPDLGGGFGPGFKVIGGYDFVNGDEDPMDDADHGTHVAGTVAADGTLKGVAPKALLYALKVLDNNGGGWSSDIILAIEWAADPNGDFDFSDHLDVINMSLGGEPQEEDPLVEAVEAATTMGVVSCISAGNSGYRGEGTIGSPGVSPSAITVGAVDKHDTIAYFSSIGPTKNTLLLKPDIVAPGVDINSTIPGADYEHFNGTSMASPHIAGVCALLKRQHPDWGPEELKSAIMLSAKDLGLAKNIQGSGRVDAYEAITIGTLVDKPSLQFGIDTLSGETVWTASDTITIRNISDSTQVYLLEAEDEGESISFSFSGSTFSLEPNSDTSLVISISVDNAIFDAQGSIKSTTITGHLNLSGSSMSYTIPWMFIRAFILNFSDVDRAKNIILFRDDFMFIGDPFWDDLTNLLMSPGKYQLIAEIYTGIGFYEGYDSYNQTSIIKELEIHANKTIALDKAEATNKIIFDSKDNLGRTYSDHHDKNRSVAIQLSDSAIYSLSRHTENYQGRAGRASLSASWRDKVHINTEYAARFTSEATFRKMDTLYFTDLPEGAKVIVAECRSYLDNHWEICFNTSESIDGIPDGEIIFSPNASNYQPITLKDRNPTEVHRWFPKLKIDGSHPSWFSYGTGDPINISQITVHLTPEGEVDKNFYYHLFMQNAFNYYTSPLRLIDNTFYFGEGRVPGAFGIAAGDTVTKATGAWLSGIRYDVSPGHELKAYVPFGKGSMNEELIRDDALLELFNDKGEKIDSGWAIVVEYQDSGRYNIKGSHDTHQSFGKKPIKNTLNLWVNMGGEDEKPPTLNTFYIKDFNGKMAETIQKNDSATIVFSLVDDDQVNADSTYYDPVLTDSTTAFTKAHYATEWIPLNIDSIGYDSRVGLVYSGVLKETNYDSAFIEIKIRCVDEAGNSNETVLSPALYVKNLQPPTAVDDFYNVTENVKFYAEGSFTDNDISPYGKTEDLKVEILSEVSNGILGISFRNWIAYKPNESFTGTDSFTYRVSNEKYTSELATVTFNVQPSALPEPINESAANISVYPNPVVDELNIKLELEEADNLAIDIFNLTGQHAASVFSGELGAGEHEISWNIESSNGDALQSGIYVIHFKGTFINEQYKVIIK